MPALNNGHMIKLIVYSVIVTTVPFCCQGQLADGLTYGQKHEIIIFNSTKYPKDAKLADKLFGLTERCIELADSLKVGMMRSGGQAPFSFLSTDPSATKFFNSVKEMYSMALDGLKKRMSAEEFNTKLIEMATTEESQTWAEKQFKGKSTIETLAELTELQTACLEVTDSVFDEIIDRNQIK